MGECGTCQVVAADEVIALQHRGGDMRIVLSPASAGTTAGLLATATIPAGEYISEHYHPYSEELVYVVRGSLRVVLDGEPQDVPTGSGLVIPRGMRHRMENVGDGELFAVIHLSPLAPRPDLGHVDTEPYPPGAPEPPPFLRRHGVPATA